MAHNNQEKERFIDILTETPFISYACKKSGINRATIYRWMKDNLEFKVKVSRSLDNGRKNLIDIAEMSLVTKIKNGDTGAVKFFLVHNSRRYRPKTPLIEKEDVPKEKKPIFRVSEQTWEMVELLEKAKKEISKAGGQVYEEVKYKKPL